MTEQTLAKPSFLALAAAGLKIGCLGFGGPAGQIALMHKVLVEERRWIDEARYLHALNYCMLLPGPEAQQLATYVGWLLRGVTGGLIFGLLFVLPGAFVVLGLSALYVTHAGSPVAAGLLLGVKAAVIAFLIEALIKVGRRALKGRLEGAIAAIAFAALFVFALPFPLVIIGALVFGALRPGAGPPERDAKPPAPKAAGSLAAAALWGAAWLAPLALAFAFLGPRHILTEIGVLFSQLAVITFGGAYATLAFLQQQAVDAQGWLSEAQMLDGLGLAETTPGPLVLVNQYVGFLAGWNGGGWSLAVAGAAMASWCTFAPSFLWIFAGAPYAEVLRRNRYVSGALRMVTAAVLGVIAALALRFSLAVLFARSVAIEAPWSTELRLPQIASFDLAACAIAAACAVALIRFKANAALVVALAAAAGWGVQAFG